MKGIVTTALAVMLIVNDEIFSLAMLTVLGIAGLYYIMKKGE